MGFNSGFKGLKVRDFSHFGENRIVHRISEGKLIKMSDWQD